MSMPPQERLRQEEEWQIALAKRASLGCSPLHSYAEALAFKYWSTGRCVSFSKVGAQATKD